MAFEATKKEWCELYTFFRLLADGRVALGTAEAKAGDIFWPVAMIQREVRVVSGTAGKDGSHRRGNRS